MANRAIQSRKAKTPEDASNLERILAGIPEGRNIAVSYLRQLSLTGDKYLPLIRDFDDDRDADIGQLCLKHSIEPSQLMADVNKAMYPVVDELMTFSKGLATDIIAKHLPAVADRAGKEAKRRDGVFDRHQILMQTGHHVAPKAAAININQNNLQAAGLASFEDDTKGMADILNDNQLLTEGDTDYIDAEEVELEAVPIGKDEAA